MKPMTKEEIIEQQRQLEICLNSEEFKLEIFSSIISIDMKG